MDLLTWLVASPLVVLYRLWCPRARFVFADLRHLWSRCDIRLSIGGWVKTAVVTYALMQGSETGARWACDMRKLWCLNIVIFVLLAYGERIFASKSHVRCKVLSTRVPSSEEALNVNWLGCLRHVCVRSQNVCFVVLSASKHVMSGEWLEVVIPWFGSKLGKQSADWLA